MVMWDKVLKNGPSRICELMDQVKFVEDNL